jgi:DNA-binding winged helix-turn-helix (wHTH) protein
MSKVSIGHHAGGSHRLLMLFTAPKARAPRPLEGEDLKTTHWEDARHWMRIYADLLEFKRGILGRIRRDIANLQPVARKAAEVDLAIIDAQMQGYQLRLDLWYSRVWELQGLWLDPTGRMVRHKGREVPLTKREFQLLEFLLSHPHRFFTTSQILGQAWADPALFPEEVRNYVRRLRKILIALEIPVDLLNKPGRGYSLVLRAQNRMGFVTRDLRASIKARKGV